MTRQMNVILYVSTLKQRLKWYVTYLPVSVGCTLEAGEIARKWSWV